MKIFLVTFFIILSLSCAYSDDLLLCTQEFCESYLIKTKCLELPEACKIENNPNATFLPSPVPCNCCDYCLANLAEESSCNIGDSSSLTPTVICGPRLGCKTNTDAKGATCQKKDNTKCLLAQMKYDQDRETGKLGHLQVRPQCDRNGFYEPFMCVPGEICYCLSEDGERIFGEVPFTSIGEHLLRCGCSRNNHKGIEIRDRNLHHHEYLRCQSNGDYDTLQCISDECLCVDARDGLPTNPEMQLINITMISADNFPCFNNETHMEAEYYRECEASYNEQFSIIKKYEKEGFEVFGYTLPNCQLDGYYAPVQQNSTAKYCADPSGKVLENFGILKSDALSSSINCNCARARSIMTGNEKPECCKNGNYKTMQCRRGMCRCVDENGLQTEKEVAYLKRDTLSCAETLCV